MVGGAVLLTFTSCRQPPAGPDDSAGAPTNQVDFVTAFQDGAQVTSDGREATLRVRKLGDLVVPTGNLVVCDAFVFDDGPVSKPIKPGRYPVFVSVAVFDKDQRVACAKLQVADKEAARWEYVSSFGVDSGTACFMDGKAAQAMEKLAGNDMKFVNEMIKKLETTYQDTWSWTDIVLEPATGANVIAFSSGFGDGGYPCYIGYDENGEVTSLAVDFGLIGP